MEQLADLRNRTNSILRAEAANVNPLLGHVTESSLLRILSRGALLDRGWLEDKWRARRKRLQP